MSLSSLLDAVSKNYTWIFSGIGIIITVILRFFFKKKSKSKQGVVSNNNNTNTFSITNTIQPSLEIALNRSETVQKDERGKDHIRILFIDDDSKFKVVSILKKAGWVHTKSLKDLVSLEDHDAKDAHIIFVDINGVGLDLSFRDQGLGLAFALKSKYPAKKIVIYSAESNGDRFHKAFQCADYCLSKNAEPYEFMSLLETFANELNVK